MKNKLKILMVFSEVAPFSKTGGLADVGGALPKFLKEMDHDVRIITPQYLAINERKYILRDVIRLQNIEVPIGKKSVKINVKSAFLPNSKVQVYFINHKSLFFRSGLYVDPKSGNDYPDNDKRFAVFSRGVLETLNKLQWQPDIIHCNDWQTALIPSYLKIWEREKYFFQNTASVFSIHNIAYQGKFPYEFYDFLGLGAENFNESKFECHGRIHFMKGGIFYADCINTVSPTYAEEITSSIGSNGVAMYIERRREDLHEISGARPFRAGDRL